MCHEERQNDFSQIKSYKLREILLTCFVFLRWGEALEAAFFTKRKSKLSFSWREEFLSQVICLTIAGNKLFGQIIISDYLLSCHLDLNAAFVYLQVDGITHRSLFYGLNSPGSC
jgi:hypothetical protein